MIQAVTNSGTAEQRGTPRSSMFLACVLRFGGQQVPVKVRNMSPTGALIETTLLPPPGAIVGLVRGSLEVDATIAWADHRHCGLRFETLVSVAQWMGRREEQNRIDRIVALGARMTTAEAPPPPAPTRTPAADLEDVARLLKRLEEALAAEPATVARHGAELQHLDIAGQLLGALIMGLQPGAADGARLDHLRTACARALGER
jgi:hypothetical protein